ncbi:uncharacterized protein [Miscanthus floridulus]|uniref:uncharacterized protein n=1 Tax=Miscanthus floridulus TaxID=154761 RepID=UPI00345AE05B
MAAVSITVNIGDGASARLWTDSWASVGPLCHYAPNLAFFARSASLLGAKELWKTKAPARVKFFFWLALHHRLWTAERRKRHGLQDDDACVLCGQESETADHLFIGCVLTREVWFALLAPLGLTVLAPGHTEDATSWWLRQRLRIDAAGRPAFDSMILLISWVIWKERNSRTFSRDAAGIQELRLKVQDADDWVKAGFKMLSVFTPYWSQN